MGRAACLVVGEAGWFVATVGKPECFPSLFFEADSGAGLAVVFAAAKHGGMAMASSVDVYAIKDKKCFRIFQIPSQPGSENAVSETGFGVFPNVFLSERMARAFPSFWPWEGKRILVTSFVSTQL